jgi:hypothetical protein
VFIGGPLLCCDTCVMMLAGPPADAMTYVNDSSGLYPSLYGGGGSPSSMSLLLDPSFVSRGSAALVSADAVAEDDDSVKGGAGVNAGGESLSSSSRSLLGTSLLCSGGKYKGGGYGDTPAVASVPGSSAGGETE